jgi:hypothetical protein
MDLESKVTGIFGRGMRRGRSSSSWNQRRSRKCPPGRSCDGMDIDGARCAACRRAETGGAQGEGATVVKHNDGGGIRACIVNRRRLSAAPAARSRSPCGPRSRSQSPLRFGKFFPARPAIAESLERQHPSQYACQRYIHETDWLKQSRWIAQSVSIRGWGYP